MDVCIKGMEMPTSCRKCDFSQPDGCGFFCPIVVGKPIVDSLTHSRHARCSLVPVPPHGRLIDADALVEDLKRQCEEVFKIDAVSPDDFWITRDEAYNERLWKTWCESFFDYLKTRATIIPSSEEGKR